MGLAIACIVSLGVLSLETRLNGRPPRREQVNFGVALDNTGTSYTERLRQMKRIIL